MSVLWAPCGILLWRKQILKFLGRLVRSRIDTLTFQPAHKVKQKQKKHEEEENCDGLDLKMKLYNMKDPD